MDAEIGGPRTGRPLIARLPGLLWHVRHACREAWRRVTRRPPPYCVFHLTHYKAGSQWIRRILAEVCAAWIVEPRSDGGQYLVDPIRPRRVYPTLYMSRQRFESVVTPPDSRRFVVIRDLRDTLISAYFSLKISHETMTDKMVRYRTILNSLEKEEALLRMIEQVCPPIAEIQRSWLNGPDEVLKYEDLLVRDVDILSRVLIDHCQLTVDRHRFAAIVAANRFEARTGGRKPGAEDCSSHERKGIAGDWRNHFTDKIARAFKDRYGELLIASGYETGDRW